MLSRDELSVERALVRRVRDELHGMSMYDEGADDEGSARRLAEEILESEHGDLDPAAAGEIVDALADDLYRCGPIEELLWDPQVTEIMVNAPDNVRAEVRGRIYKSNQEFESDEHVKFIMDRITAASGRRCDEGMPLCDCTLVRPGTPFDGARVNAVCMPLAKHHTLTIRKFSQSMQTIDDLRDKGSLDQCMYELLEAIVAGRQNLVICGGTGSGKTTLLNAVASWIPDDQRIVTVEDTYEMSIDHPDIVALQARPANSEGKGETTIRDLVENSLRQRPDRIIVGECRKGEAFEMLQAMGTGHPGSLTTVHANNPREALTRLRSMVQMAGIEMTSADILEFITSTVDFIVSVSRMPDGTRRVTELVEVLGMQGDVPTTATIRRFRQDPWDGGAVTGEFEATGEPISRTRQARMRAAGVAVDDWWWT